MMFSSILGCEKSVEIVTLKVSAAFYVIASCFRSVLRDPCGLYADAP
jgi:hypothetical protein